MMLNLVELEEACKIMEDAIPGPPHKWGKWHHSVDFDLVERDCLCGAKQAITGQALSHMSGPHDAVKYLETMFKNTAPHDAVQEALNTDIAIGQLKTVFGEVHGVQEAGEYGILEQMAAPELELNDEAINRIIEWLNSDPRQHETKSEYWEMIIIVSQAPSVQQQLGDTGEIVHLPYVTLLIRRLPIIMVDDRWWMEVAVRVDTGEPVASVNHKGSYEEFRKEILNAPPSNS